VASTSDDGIEAAQVISAWLSVGSKFLSPTGEDSVPFLAHLLR
jgi:hypothetical protein